MRERQNVDRLVSFVLSEIALLTGMQPVLLPVVNMDARYEEVLGLLPQAVQSKLALRKGDLVAVNVKERFHQYAILANYFRGRPLGGAALRGVVFLVAYYLQLIHRTYPQFAHRNLVCRNIFLYPSPAARRYPALGTAFRLQLPFNLKLVHLHRAQLFGAQRQTYDLHTFLVSLMQEVVPDWRDDREFADFVHDVVGKENVNLNVSFEDFVPTDYSTTEQVLAHPYFAPLAEEPVAAAVPAGESAEERAAEMQGGCGCSGLRDVVRQGQQSLLSGLLQSGGGRKRAVQRFETQRREVEEELRRLQERIEKDQREAARLQRLLGDYVEDSRGPAEPAASRMAQLLGVQPAEAHMMQNAMVQQVPYYQQMYYPAMHPPAPYVPIPPPEEDFRPLLERQLYRMPMPYPADRQGVQDLRGRTPLEEVEKKNDR